MKPKLIEVKTEMQPIIETSYVSNIP